MDNLLGNIYCIFESLFGSNLSLYLWGYNPNTETFSNPNLFNLVGMITIAVSLVIVLGYYYVFSHPKYSRWWSWLLVLLLNSSIALIIGYGLVHSKYVHGFIPDSLLRQIDDEGNTIAMMLGDTNIFGFGVANFFVATGFYLLFTLLFKWWSHDAKHVPF